MNNSAESHCTILKTLLNINHLMAHSEHCYVKGATPSGITKLSCFVDIHCDMIYMYVDTVEYFTATRDLSMKEYFGLFMVKFYISVKNINQKKRISYFSCNSLTII